MTATVIQLRDYDAHRRPADGEARGPAEVVILPVEALVERRADGPVPPVRRLPRASLLGDFL